MFIASCVSFSFTQMKLEMTLKRLFMTFNILLESKINISLWTDLIFTDHSQINYSSAKLITGLFISFMQTSGSSHLTAADTN